MLTWEVICNPIFSECKSVELELCTYLKLMIIVNNDKTLCISETGEGCLRLLEWKEEIYCLKSDVVALRKGL